MQATRFHFVGATWTQRTLRFRYAIEFSDAPRLRFTETLELPRRKAQALPAAFKKNILKNLHLVLGLSYYKLYCPTVLALPYALSQAEADFWTTLYTEGLGEFYYRNQIDFRGRVKFPAHAKTQAAPVHLPTQDQVLLGLGGGKDSIVAGEWLKTSKLKPLAFEVQTGAAAPVVKEVAKTMHVPLLTVKRTLDSKILKPLPGAFNGHIPISTVFAFVGILLGALYGRRWVAVANAHSSDFGNLIWKGQNINHQWSKTARWEALFQAHVRDTLSPDLGYFSPLRHLYEIRVVEALAQMPQYFKIFTSCNRNFRIHKDRPATRWCGVCPKCAFMFLQLAAFLPGQTVSHIFGKNLLDDPTLIPLFKDLLGLGTLKPFDCVGTFEESQAAFHRTAQQFKNAPVIKAIRCPKPDETTLFAVHPAPTLPAPFKFLGLKNVLILGYGKEGQTTERWLKKNYPGLELRIADQSTDPKYLDQQDRAEFAVKTPGLPKSKVRLPYTTATNIFMAQNRVPTIGVTGSKGKSTTASLIAHLLGRRAKLLGNIGKPMLEELLGKSRPEVYVLELSSYQLDDLTVVPNIAVVTNLFPEHMNYHGSEEAYYEAKKNILLRQSPADLFICNNHDARLKVWVKEAPGQVLPFAWGKYKSPLLGDHNQANIAAAVAVARLFKTPQVNKRLKSFQALPHRLQKIGTFRGITFYDDAISTTPESTIAAIEALSKEAPIGTLFLGGEDRGYDFRELEKTVRAHKIPNLVLFPDTGARMLKSRTGFNVLESRSLKEAVAWAYANTPKGTICVLSMASPSYSLWKNFEAKGDEFQGWVLDKGVMSA